MNNNSFNKNRYSFNKDRYFHLLVKDNRSKAEYLELISYEAVLECQVMYNNRFKYISLVEELLQEVRNPSPDSDEFDDYPSPDSDEFDDLYFSQVYLDSAAGKFSTLIEKDLENYNILENKCRKEGVAILDNFEISPENASKFADELHIIDNFFEDANSEEEWANLVDAYPSLLKQALPYLRYYANPDSGPLKDNQILREIMILFTLITGVTYTLLNPTLFTLIWK